MKGAVDGVSRQEGEKGEVRNFKFESKKRKPRRSLVLGKMGGCFVYRVRMIGIKPCLGSWDVGRGEVVGERESQRLSSLVGDPQMDGDGMRFVTSDPSQVPEGSADVTPGLHGEVAPSRRRHPTGTATRREADT